MHISIPLGFKVLLTVLATASFVSAAPRPARAAVAVPREGRCHESPPGSGYYIC